MVHIIVNYNYARTYASRCFQIAKLASYWIVFSLVYKSFVCAKCLEKQKTKAKPHGVVYSLWYVNTFQVVSFTKV